MTNLQAALEYAARGWRVIPIPTGQKHPAITAWQQRATTNTDTITQWWTTNPNHGIGIATGPESGIWVLDIDIADGKHGDETLTELETQHGQLPDTHEVITGSGGRHIYFTWPTNGQTIRNNQSGRIGPGIDIRGEGGQVLAPPTVHPNGTPYTHELGAPDTTSQAPEWLLTKLTDTEPTPHTHTPASTDDPGAQWANNHPWQQLLAGDGWTQLRNGPNGEQRWARPGKKPADGPSATVGYGGTDLLKVFTSSHPHLQADDTYTRFGYLTATRFNGDYSAAAAWCRQQGYGTNHGDPRDLIAPTTTPTVAGQMPEPTAPWTTPGAWPTTTSTPPFPITSLPQWAQNHVEATASQLQAPTDLTAMLAIGALSAAATGRAQVAIHDRWTEPINLYLTVAMRSGAGKSPAEKAMVTWIREWQRDRIAAAQDEHDQARTLADFANKKARKLRDAGIAPQEDILTAAAEAKAATDNIPPLPRLIIDDVRPEIVAGLLAEHGQALAVLSSEADLFDMLMRGKAGQRENMNVFLKAWSGDELVRDRKGTQEHGPEHTTLTNPLLTVSNTVQPRVLHQLLTDGEMAGRGLAPRFMFAVPQDIMGSRSSHQRFRPTASSTADAYNQHARALATQWAFWDGTATIGVTDQAIDLFEAYTDTIEPELAVSAELGNLAEWVSKMIASVIRYAGLLHIAEGNDTNTAITVDTAARACELGTYWLTQALALQSDGRASGVADQAQAMMDWVAGTGRATVTAADIRKGHRPGGLNTTDDYIPVLEWLCDAGWLRPQDPNGLWITDVGRRGRQSPTFTVWPDVVGQPQSVLSHKVASTLPNVGSDTYSDHASPTVVKLCKCVNVHLVESKTHSSVSTPQPGSPAPPKTVTHLHNLPNGTHTPPVDNSTPQPVDNPPDADILFPAT